MFGLIRLRVIADTASAPPHHFNSQAAQKPMIARAESGEDWIKRNAPKNSNGSQVQTSDNPVEINQEIQLGSVKFKLEAIEKNQYGGYSFLFNGADGGVVQCVVELAGHPTNMSGGSSFNQGDPFHFYQSVMYRQIPTGMLTVRVSQPAVLGDLISFIGSWSPEK